MLIKGEVGDARLRASREHIIPSALGGPDSLSTFDVCTGCNSSLGETTDSELMRENIISIVRQRFGIAGYSGKVPDVIMPAKSIQTGDAFEMRIPHSGKVSYNAPPEVTQTIGPNGDEHFSVRGNRGQVQRIVEGKKAKAERQGRRVLNPDGSILTSVQDAIASAVAELTTEVEAGFSYNQIVVWRGLIKIAFEFAHVVLGNDWTFAAEAEPLREAALGRSSDESVAALVSGLGIGFRGLLMRDETDKATRHMIALLPGREKLIAISLFGEPLLTAAVRIEATSQQWEEAVTKSTPVMVTTLPKGGDPQWVDLLEFARRLALAKSFAGEPSLTMPECI